MRNLKRALSLALASVMLMGMMVVGTGASYADVDSKDNAEAIEVLQAVGVMSGDENGNFNPDKNVTRNEMAVVMANLLDLKVSDFNAAKIPFTDVPAWANAYVAACVADGITAGYSATYFGGNDGVTAAQAALMLMKALGYFQYASDFGDDWQLATVKQASRIELFDGVDAGAAAALTRNELAQMVLNALKTPMVEAVKSGSTVVVGDITITSDVSYEEILKSKSASKYDKIDGADADGKFTVELGENLFDGKLVLDTTSMRDVFGAPANKWTYKGDEVGRYVGEDAVLTYLKDFDADELKDLKKDDYDFSKATVYVNGASTELSADEIAARDYAGTVIEMYANGDGDKNITHIVLKQAYIAQVEDLDDESISVKVWNPWDAGKTASITENDNEKKDDDWFDKLSAKYDEDDYFVIYLDEADLSGDIIAYADAKTAAGKVATTKISDADDGMNGYLTIDGTKYTMASGYSEDVVINAGDEYTIYLDENGFVLHAETVKESAGNIDDVYYVDNVWTKTSNVAGNTITTYHAQLVAMDGTISEIELENLDKEGNKTSDTYDVEKYEGKLVTISDKKWTDGKTPAVTHKSGDDKFDLKVWAPNSEKTWDLADGVTFTSNFEKNSTRVTTSSDGTFRLNSSTKYIFVEGTKDKLDSAVYTGGVAYTVSKATASKSFVITEDGSKLAKYVIVVTNDADQAQTYSDDAVYIKSNSSEKGDGYRVQEVYTADGKKTTLNVDEGEYGTTLKGFYTYDTNDDGYYVLDDANTMTISGSFVWDDEEGVIADATIAKDALFDGLLTVTKGSHKVEDIDVSSASFVDIHSKTADGQYTKSVSSLASLTKLVDDEKVGEVKLSLNVSKDGAVIIVVTSIASK